MKNLTIIFFSICMIVFSKSFAQSKQSFNSKPTIILVHGLWADGSSWNKIIHPLIDKGYSVVSVQNPTTSLADDVAATNRAIEMAKGDVVLVGHSWGGFVITEAGNNPKVKSLVYVAAFAPDKGENIEKLSANAPATKLSKYIIAKDNFVTLLKEGIIKAFANDLSPKEQSLIYSVQQPASVKVFEGSVQNPAWKTKPSWYIVATKDETISPELHTFMAKRAKSKTFFIPSSHVAMLSKPKEVLNVILEAASSATEN